jgi:aldose 1-epimerase
MNRLFTIVAFIAVGLFSCKSNKQPEAQTEVQQPKDSLSISKAPWGKVDNKDIYLYSLTNANGMKVDITNFGAIVVSIYTKDKSDSLANVVMGFDSLAQYQTNPNFYGVTVGRYANRIAKAKFKLDGKEYKLNANDGKNSLHGGLIGFHKKVWDATELTGADSVALQLSYTSPDMEEGYPGNLKSTVTFVLNDANELKIYYSAETDKPTVINLTNHSYFNLSGGKESILNHNLTILADSITPVNAELIPTGKIETVKGTAFDFTTPHKIGERIAQIKGGYDHNFVLSKAKSTYGRAVELADSASGRVMEMFTSEPGVQFYSGNFLDGTFTGHNKVVYNQYWGLCLEAQHYPDSPNQPKFPSVVLNPGEKYYQLTVYKFSVKK